MQHLPYFYPGHPAVGPAAAAALSAEQIKACSAAGMLGAPAPSLFTIDNILAPRPLVRQPPAYFPYPAAAFAAHAAHHDLFGKLSSLALIVWLVLMFVLAV